MEQEQNTRIFTGKKCCGQSGKGERLKSGGSRSLYVLNKLVKLEWVKEKEMEQQDGKLPF